MENRRGSCGAPVRGGGTCTLDYGHRKGHSTITFVCDACGHARRGTPYAYGRDGEYPQGLQFCFLCARGITFRKGLAA